MKQTLFKTWLMLACLLVGVGTTWADTVNFTMGSGKDVTSNSGATKSGITITATDGTSTANNWGGTTYVRLQAGGSFVIAPSSATITSIVLNCTSGYEKTWSASSGSAPVVNTTAHTVTWSGSTMSAITLTNTASAQARVSSIDVTYTSNGGSTPTTLSAPANLTSSNITSTGATLSWDKVTNASSYTVKIGEQEYTGVNTNSYSATGLTAGTQYTWTVKAVGDGVNYSTSAYAANANFTTETEQGGGEGPGDGEKTGTIKFGTNDVKINAASVTGKDDLENTWAITTAGTSSYTANTTYYQVGKSAEPATSITFTTTLPDNVNITKMSAKFGGFSGTAGTVTLKVGETTIGAGSLNAANDVTVSSNKTASGKVLTVTVTGIAKGVKVYNISYTYTTEGGEDPDPEKELIAIQATGTPATFWKGDTFNHNGITVTATWSDDTQTDVTSSATFSGYDMSTAGAQTVTVSYLEKTATYGINIQTIANTQETAYTVSEAKALIDAGKDLATQVYVTGTISEIVTPWSDQYSNITYNISDDGETTGLQFQLFRCATNGGEVGDAVVAKGTMTFYSQTSTYEFTSGNTIVDIQKPAAKTITALTVSGTPTKTTYNVGDAFETAGLVVTATYSDETTAPITTGFEWEIDYGTGNEALVAGATSVGVMVYTEGQEVTSEVYTVNGLTVTVPVTLTSIAVSGTPTKTEYYVGDAFETAGLVVTGTYSDSHQEVITEGIEWTVDPEELALGTTSVDVMAGVGSIVSEVYTVNGLTVTKPDFETVTYNFSSFTSGASVELTDLDGFVITLKSNGGTNPAWNVGASEARVYAKGSLTVKANNAIIKSIEYDYVVNANSKGVTPTIDGVEGTTDSGTWDVENKTWTGADEEVTFSTSGSAGNIGFTKLIIKYVESNKTETSLAWSATEYEATIGAENVFPTLSSTPADLTGVTYESSNTEVATIAEDGSITLIKAGETTITANYAGNAEYASATPASYTLTVVKAPFVPTPAADGYEAVNFATLYSSVTTNATVEDYEGSSFAMAFAKPQSSTTPTKYYDNGKAVRAYEGNTITITAAEPIKYIDIAWTVEDDAVSITGLNTTTAVVTFSKTCRFTKITVSYKGSNSTLVATDGENYYATFSSDKSVKFIDAEVSTVEVVDGKLSIQEVANKRVPAGNAVLIKSATTDVNYYFVDKDEDFENNNLVPTTTNGQFMSETDDNYYYKLAYGNVTAKTGLGFWYGAADGSGMFNVKAGGAVLVVPKSAGGAVRGFSFTPDNVVTGLNSLNSMDNQNSIYNLQGIRMQKLQRGVNIVNGRKVIR